MLNKKLSLHDFKNWLVEQKDLSDFFNIGLDKENPDDEFIGREARSKVGSKKLLERIETEDDAETIVNEFVQDGGTVLEVKEKKIHIEVDSGSFYVPRFCVKILKEIKEQPDEPKL